MKRTRARRHGGSRRGAATAEAILAFMIMTIFMFLALWIHTGYSAKLREEAKTRNEALTEASHSCSGGDSMGTGASIGGQAASIAGNVGGGMGDTMSMKSVTKTGAASFSQSVRSGNLGRRDRSGRVEAWSSVLCRPEPQSSVSPMGAGLGSLRGSIGL